MLRIFMQRAFSAQEINYNSSAKIHHFADMAKKNSIKNYMWHNNSKLLLPRHIQHHDSGDEEDERKNHKGNSEVFKESGVGLLQVENTVETRKDEGSGKE